jgi:hypothetical protein
MPEADQACVFFVPLEGDRDAYPSLHLAAVNANCCRILTKLTRPQHFFALALINRLGLFFARRTFIVKRNRHLWRHPGVRLALLLAATNLRILWAQPVDTPPADGLLSAAGPTFRITENQLTEPLTLVAYGDQRFTNPGNIRQTNPRIRQWLVKQIAKEHPAAVIMNGDVPLAGGVADDYTVFEAETKPWRDLHLQVFPTLGNHEFHGDPQQDLENWWNAFPQMRNRRWYSAQLGQRVYLIALDSDTSLLPGSNQARWIEKQIDDLPPSVDFVIVTLHHPPVADVQQHIEVDHNPRPNEMALRDYLSKAARSSHASFLVSAGHIHNYERHVAEGVTYLVSGGGGAPPHFVERAPNDLYKSILFPNYHYVRLTVEKDRLHGDMLRVENPEAENLILELKDSFDIAAKPH